MVFDHKVKYKGKWYLPGEEIEEKVDEAVDTASLPFEKPYTKTEINTMKVDDLRSMARNTGVESADDMTGAELKEYFINLFNL